MPCPAWSNLKTHILLVVAILFRIRYSKTLFAKKTPITVKLECKQLKSVSFKNLCIHVHKSACTCLHFYCILASGCSPCFLYCFLLTHGVVCISISPTGLQPWCAVQASKSKKTYSTLKNYFIQCSTVCFQRQQILVLSIWHHLQEGLIWHLRTDICPNSWATSDWDGAPHAAVLTEHRTCFSVNKQSC